MSSLEILRKMGPDSYKRNSLKLAKEIIELLKELAPKMVSEYEKDSEVFPCNEYSNRKSIKVIDEVIGELEGKEASHTYGEPIKFNQTSQFREPFSLRVDLKFGKKKYDWPNHNATECLVGIGRTLWMRTGAHQSIGDGTFSEKQVKLLQLIDYKQRMEQYDYEYRSAKEDLEKFSIDLENINSMEFNRKLDQANKEYWESRQTMRNLRIYLDDLSNDKLVLKKKTEVENKITEIKERVGTAIWYFETRKKYLEDQGFDPDKFDLWGSKR